MFIIIILILILISIHIRPKHILLYFIFDIVCCHRHQRNAV